MNIRVLDALIAAVCYADIFDYPLTEKELAEWFPFITVHKDVHGFFMRALQEKNVEKYIRRLDVDGDAYFGLNIDKDMIAARLNRAECSIEKWNRARKVARLLGMIIPTIQLVGVTGGLSRSNTKPEDDIDFLIITTDTTLWATRALSTILLDIVHLRRRPADTNVRNLVCLNMFMSEDGLSVPKHERDLFSAHEVLLMTPLLDRNGAYKKFLSANRWVKTFLPKAWEQKFQASSTKLQKNSKSKIQNKSNVLMRCLYLVFRYCLGFVIWVLRFAEVPARVIQLWYMNRRRTTEVISNTVIRFHPRDARGWIKRKLGERLTRFNVPLDKIFYGR